MKSSKTISLQEFLDFFPLVELPIALSEEVIDQISRVNKVFPEAAIAQYISKWEAEVDNMSEFLPCCQLAPQEDFYSIIYWKASLMTYEFILATIDKNGEPIQQKVIAGVVSNGSSIIQSVAKLEDDLSIHIMVGEKKVNDLHYNPFNSKGYYVEILPNGQLISSKDEDELWQEKNINNEN